MTPAVRLQLKAHLEQEAIAIHAFLKAGDDLNDFLLNGAPHMETLKDLSEKSTVYANLVQELYDGRSELLSRLSRPGRNWDDAVDQDDALRVINTHCQTLLMQARDQSQQNDAMIKRMLAQVRERMQLLRNVATPDQTYNAAGQVGGSASRVISTA